MSEDFVVKKVEGGESAGEALAQARQKRHFTLEDVARDLKIQRKYLRDIETACYDKLPAEVHAIGFIKSYARYLQLDEKKIVDLYKRELSIVKNLAGKQGEPKPAKTYSDKTVIVTPRFIKIGAIVLAILGLFGYLWYQISGLSVAPKLVIQQPAQDITVSDIFNATKKCLKNNITPILSFMSGFPDETIGDLKMTHDTIEKLLQMDKRVTVNGVFVYNPYPGGELFEDSIRNGIETPSAFEGWGDWDYKYDANHPWIGKEKQNYMKMLFLLVRFSYYWKELGRRNDFKKKYVIRFLLIPLKLSFALRWKRKLFSHGYEWHLWSWFMRNAVGYL